METKYDYSVKTNFFHVKDESTFRIFMSNVVTTFCSVLRLACSILVTAALPLIRIMASTALFASTT